MRKEIGRALPFVNVCHSQGSYIDISKELLNSTQSGSKMIRNAKSFVKVREFLYLKKCLSILNLVHQYINRAAEFHKI
ncbi:hypothetical protein A3Q35_17190 [Aeribacillus pallidus]|nr:hypothetical protein A3Q35_17190 [Aeribacillus pallidus]